MDESIVKQLTTLIERITRVEAKLDLSLQLNETSNKTMTIISERVAKIEASSKSAHKRCDDIENARKEDKAFTRWAVGIAIALASLISGIINMIFRG